MINSSEYKKAKVANNNVVTKASHNEYKDVLLNKTCIRHSMNRIYSIITQKINKFFFLAFITKFIFLIMELIC